MLGIVPTIGFLKFLMTVTEYPEARLVFAHRDGRLFELEEVMSLLGSEVTLTATIETPQGDARGQFNLTLFELRRLDDLE